VIAGSFILVGIYDLLQGQAPDANLPSLQQVISWWDWKIWFIIALFLLLIGTLEGTYRYIKRIKVQIRKEVNEQIEEQKRKERKVQRTRDNKAVYIPDKLHELYMTSKRIADEKHAKQKLTYEQMQQVAERLTQVGILQELGDVFLGFATAPSYEKLEEMIKNSDYAKTHETMKKLLIFFKSAMSELQIGISNYLEKDEEYKKLYDDIQRRIVGLPPKTQSRIYDYIETVNSLNNIKFIDLPKLSEALELGLIAPVGTLMLQQLEQSINSYLSPMLSLIRQDIDTFLLGEDV